MKERYLIIVSQFNDMITKALLAGAESAFEELGVDKHQCDVLWVPGSFELPAVAARAAAGNSYRAIVCLGAVIRGETPHFDFVASQAAAGLMRISIDYKTPVIFGVLTTDNVDQALARSGRGTGNKGREAAQAAVLSGQAMDRLDQWMKG